MHSLRFDGETDAEFRDRAERKAQIANVIVTACLKNDCMRSFIDDLNLPMYTVEGVRNSPTVRVEYEQAIAIGCIGECLAATSGKSWGDGPHVLPLQSDDWFYPDRITYVYKENSLYNRRFEQRRRMKSLLGRQHRPLVTEAKRRTKREFLQQITRDQARIIRRVFGVGPGEFWRAASGKSFLNLPPEYIQWELEFGD